MGVAELPMAVTAAAAAAAAVAAAQLRLPYSSWAWALRQQLGWCARARRTERVRYVSRRFSQALATPQAG